MVRLVRSHIAVGIRIPVVIHGFTVIILHGSIKGTLNSSLQIYSPLDRLIILRRKDLDFLYMKPGLQAAGGNAVSIRVLGFPHGSLPAEDMPWTWYILRLHPVPAYNYYAWTYDPLKMTHSSQEEATIPVPSGRQRPSRFQESPDFQSGAHVLPPCNHRNGAELYPQEAPGSKSGRKHPSLPPPEGRKALLRLFCFLLADIFISERTIWTPFICQNSAACRHNSYANGQNSPQSPPIPVYQFSSPDCVWEASPHN